MSNEAKVLSAVLKDKQIHVLMQANIGRLLRTHPDVWEFIRDYAESNGSVPPVNIVEDKFPDFKYLEDVGASKHHLNELQAEYVDASVRNILRQAAGLVQEGRSADAVNKLISESADIKKATTAVKDIDIVDADSAIAYFESIKSMDALGGNGIRTGLPGFDAVLPSGISEGMLGIFLAYPGIGKSFLAMYFAAQAWKQGKVPMIVSLEMSEAEVRNRIFAILGDGQWALSKLARGDVDLDVFKKWHHETFDNKPPMYIISSEGVGEVNPSVVNAKIDQYKPDFVILDYLQLMSPNKQGDNEVIKMKNLSSELKALARSAAIPILAISSATPDDVTNLNEPPTLGQTAWSRQIAYDSDFLVALGRDQDSDVVEGVFRKNRHGPQNSFFLQVDFNHGKFNYIDDDEVS